MNLYKQKKSRVSSHVDITKTTDATTIAKTKRKKPRYQSFSLLCNEKLEADENFIGPAQHKTGNKE